MKKTAISLAVAAAMTASFAAQADTTLYGRIGQSIDYNDPDGGDSNWDVENFTSRWGLKGSEDLGNGLKAVYRYEWSISTEGDGVFGRRLAYVGLEGGFGQIKLGQQWTPYYNVVGYSDIMNSVGYNLYSGIFRKSDSVVYQTPDLGGFQVEAMVNMDGAAGETGVDNYNVALSYSNGPLFAGVAFLANEVTDKDQLGASIGYTFGPVSASVSYENTDFNTSNLTDLELEDLRDDLRDNDTYYVAATYDMGAGNSILAQYGGKSIDDADDLNEFSVGFQHMMGSRTRVFAEYNDQEDVGGRLRLGLRTDF